MAEPIHGSQPGEHAARVKGRQTPAEIFAQAVFPTGQVTVASNRGIVTATGPAGTADRVGRTPKPESVTFQVSENTRTEAGEKLNNAPFPNHTAFGQAVLQKPDGSVVLARQGISAERSGPTLDGDTHYFKGVWNAQARAFVAQGDPITPSAADKTRLDGILTAADTARPAVAAAPGVAAAPAVPSLVSSLTQASATTGVIKVSHGTQTPVNRGATPNMQG